MPDTTNQAAGQGTDAGEGKQPTGADQKPVADAKIEGGEGKDKGEGGEGTEPGKGEGADKAKAPTDTSKEDDEEFKDDGTEPPTTPRMSSKDFIIRRQQRKIAKLKEKSDEEGGEGEADDEIAPEDEALITKVIAKKFAPIIDKTQSAEDEREISEFLAKNPEFTPFEAKARRYIAHPSRRNLPVESVFYEVAGKELLKIGAKRQREADEKALDTQTGGGSARGGEGGKSVWDLTKDEFEAEQEEIRRKQSA